MKNKILMLVMAATLGACAGQQMQTEWTSRGYSKPDQDAILAQWKVYLEEKLSAERSSNAFNTSPKHEFNTRMTKIFCACYKKIGEKCRKSPDGLSPEDKALWVKANAVDYTAVGTAMSWETNGMSKIDSVECQ